MPAPTRTRGDPRSAGRPSGARATRVSAAPKLAGLAAGLALLTGVAVVVALLATRGGDPGAPATRPATPLAIGAKAPALNLTDAATGHPYALASDPGAVTLVSFLSTQPDTADTPSRSQAVTLVSLATQYGTHGLHVAVVDDSSVPTGISALTNTVYDWRLGPVALLADPDHAAADQYGITSPPTSYLISASGTVLARWSGYVLTSTAAATITANLPAAPKS